LWCTAWRLTPACASINGLGSARKPGTMRSQAGFFASPPKSSKPRIATRFSDYKRVQVVLKSGIAAWAYVKA
jgi:hypothetical protein